jgi:osmoprotectant transport system ATP-binding protein
VFVTHDIEEALLLASDIAILERGRLVQWGTPLDLLEHPASGFVAEFVGGSSSGLKLLSLRTVAERLHPGEAAEGEPLPSNASLRDALAAMAARHTDRLPVVDAAGQPLGAITLGDLVR